MIIVPEMIGSVVGVYNGLSFSPVEVKVCFRCPAFFVVVRSRSFFCTLAYFPNVSVFSLLGRNDWTLFGRIFYHLQTMPSRSTWYWCYSLLEIYPIEVKFLANHLIAQCVKL
jgi:hypothetical protein